MPHVLETWYSNVPVVTRLHATGLFLVHMCVHFGFIEKYRLYFNPSLVFSQHQYWRIITAFLYYGEGDDGIGIEFFYTLNMIVFSYYLEREWFSERTIDFVWVYLLSMISLLAASTQLTLPFVAVELHLVFFQLWYLYVATQARSRALVFFSWAMSIALASTTYYYSIYGRFVALVIGALYHFLENVFPTWAISRGVHVLRAPEGLRRLV